MVLLTSIIRRPLILTASPLRHRHSPPLSNYYQLAKRLVSSTDTPTTTAKPPESGGVERLVAGCDYEHWLVVMEAPKGYPLRDEIVSSYVKTLSLALGSEEEAKKSIYSVSTKYYFAFGCKVSSDLTYKIRSLPNVKWVLPDSYLHHDEDGYGGEPFVNGEVVTYDEKYHKDWVQDQSNVKHTQTSKISKSQTKRNRKSLPGKST